MKKSLFSRICAVSLSALTVFGAGALGGVAFDKVISPTVSAYSTNRFSSIKNADGGVSIVGYYGNETNIVIPSEVDGLPVTEIRFSSFDRNDTITSVYIPGTVKKIGDGAFSECSKLSSVVMEDGVEEIGIYAFKDCPNLRNITIPSTLVTVHYTAFDNTPWYNSLPNGDVYLGKTYFKYKGTLPADSAVKIKEGTKTISKRAFINQTGLKSVEMPEGLTNIYENAFESCTYLNSVKFPSTLKTVEGSAFYFCSRLYNIELPDNVEYLGTNSFLFSGWYNIHANGDVYLNGFYVHYKGDMPENFTLKIKEGTKGIVGFACSECKNMTSLVIPSSVKYIGSSAFAKCASLKHVSIPSGVESIENFAFSKCTSLTSVSIPKSAGQLNYHTFSDCTALTSVTIPYGMTALVSSNFSGCTALKSITVPSTVSDMGYQNFKGCENLTIYGTSDSAAQKYAADNNIPFAAGKAPLASLAVLSADTIDLGESVTVKCYTDSGNSPKEFAVYYKKESSTKWTVAQKYSSAAKVKITPKSGVVYDVRVKVKDAKGKIAYNDLKLTVRPPLKNTSKLGAYEIKLGEKVKIRGSAYGGAGNYEFALSFKKHSQKEYRVIHNFNSKYTVYLQPGSAVDYDIKVDVKDEKGTVVSKTMLLKVTN